jgi:hypothetical protein
VDPTSLGDSRDLVSPKIEYNGVDDPAAQFIPPMHLDGRENRSHPTDISTTYNSVGGNMTQLNVTSYGESGVQDSVRNTSYKLIVSP